MDPMQYAYDGKKLVVIRSHSDVYVQGRDQSELEVLPSDLHAARVEETPDSLQIVLTADAEVTLPVAARLLLERGSGDAYLRGLTGSVEINKINGDLHMQDLGTVEVGWVDGDLLAQNISGVLQVHKVAGDIQVMDCRGPFNLDAAGGDLEIMDAGGPVSAKIGGDARVGLAAAGHPVSVRCGGDITLHVTSAADAVVSFSSGGHDIRIELAGNDLSFDQRNFSQTFGNGSVPIRLEAGGDILLTDAPWDGEDLESEFTEMDDRWEEWMQDREERFEEMNRRAEELVRRVSERSQEATRRAEERMQQVIQRVEERRRRMEERFSGPIPPTPPTPPIPPIRPVTPRTPVAPTPPITPDAPKISKVTAEERMMVLRMLAEGKINAEEANNLLDALEKGAG